MRSSTSRAAVAALTAAAALLPAVAAAAPASGPTPGATASVRFLGERTVPYRMDYAGTTVGGLSGIDRDPCTGEYVLISDDRSVLQPARFYTASITVNGGGVRAVRLTGTHPFRRADGATYPPLNDPRAVDPEELRVDPRTCTYWWAQEGNRPTGPTSPEPLIQPSVNRTDRSGGYLGTFPLPANYAISMQDHGPRRNQTLEAITFGASGALLTSALEAPLIQDGPVPTLDHGALSRVTVQTRTGRVLAQYAYPMEPVFAAPVPDSPWQPDTGVPAILAFPEDPGRFLVMERSWVDGSGYKIRIFDATIRGATDVRRMDSLAGQSVVPMPKTLLADLDSFPLSGVNNVEGMTWGPRLPTGERTLVLVSDDNFSGQEATQVIALALR